MEQVKKNMEELRETIRKYGEMPICPERANFLANCWAAYMALGVLCGEEDAAEHTDHDGSAGEPLTSGQIMHWTGQMENADGTRGAHWTMEQTEQAREKLEIGCRPTEFYAAMNIMYSDYCKAAEQAGCSSTDLYARMAKAFLEDKDARPDKLARYYHFIAEK